MTTLRLLMTRGNRKSSKKDSWLGARIAGPSRGTFSRPFTFGRYSNRRMGPRNTHFMSHQYMTPPRREPPRGALATSPIDYPDRPREGNPSMLGFGVLEWTFVALLVLLVGAAGVFG